MPKNPSPYYVRQHGRSAVCFYCRTNQRLEPDADLFRLHYDVVRTGDKNDGSRAWRWEPGHPREHLIREVVGCAEVCPGSNKAPIPMSHEFPDGVRIPRYRFYRW